MATVRFPAVVLLPAALAAAVVLGADVGDPEPLPPDVAADESVVAALDPLPAAEVLPVASGAGARGSVWFCAPGTASGDGLAEQVVVVANAGSGPASATVTVIPDEGEPVVEELEIEASSRTALEVADLVDAEWAGAIVEVDAGEIAVDHLLSGPTGTAAAPCATTPSDQAWFPSGATEAGATEVLAILNPFPDEAVVSVSFETEDGARTPEDLEAKVVPPRSILVLDVGERVAVRREVSTSVAVTSGQVVIDRIQSYDGSGDRSGLGLSPGIPRPSSTWWFPGVELSDERAPAIVVVNPDRDAVARVEVAVRTGGDGEDPEPFGVEVAPGRYLVVPLDRDGRVPFDTPLSVVVRSPDDHPVVAELLTATSVRDETTEERSAVGFALGSGSPVVAPRWLVAHGSLGDTSAATISVVNPGAEPVTVTVDALSKGARDAVGAPVTIPAGGRADIDVAGGAGHHPAAFDVVADGGIVVSRQFTMTSGEVTDALAVPVVTGVVVAPAG